MLTLFITTQNDEHALARMLPPLVCEVVSGTISNVIIYDLGSTDQTVKVAEHAGCCVVSAGSNSFADALLNCRGQWVMFLAPGALLSANWSDLIIDHINSNAGAASPAEFQLAKRTDLPWWRRMMNPRISAPANADPALGYLIDMGQLRSGLKPNSTLQSIMRGRAVKRLNIELNYPFS